MARRSQCSSAGDNPLDPNYLPPHYREEYRLAIDALVEEDLEGYYQFLHKADVVDFLSTPEIQYIQSSVQVPQQSNFPEQRFLGVGEDGSSDTYWPIHSDLDAPGLDLGWPQLHPFIGPTEVTTLVNPPEPDMPSIKEQARRLIKNAQQVIAIVMDMFTDVDIFADILNAAMRNVAVYIILDLENAHHFINMVSNCRVNLQSIQFLRVRTVSGITYHCRSGKSFKGQMMDRFLLTDCRAVLSGNYSFMWSFEKLHRCMAHLFLGQLVSTFDEEFRILFAQSEPLMIENAPVEDFSLLQKRQYPSERPLLYREPRKFLSMDTTHPDEWARHSHDERTDLDWRLMPRKRQEPLHAPADAYGRFPSQQSHMDPSFDQAPYRMQMMDNLALKRHSYAEGVHGRYSYPFHSMQPQGMPEPENQGRPFHRGQQPYPGPGKEGDYSGYDRFWNQDFLSTDQYSEPGLPQEMEPPDNFDPVLNYLSSTRNTDFDQGSGKLADLPFSSSQPKRLSLGQPYACQTSPTPPNPTDQKQFFQEPTTDRKDPMVKRGLRNWRISSYLSAYDNSGDEGLPLAPPNAPDPFEEASNPIPQTAPGIDLSVPKIPNVREFKIPAIPRASQMPSYAKTTAREQPNKLPDEPTAVAAENKTTPTPSESSSTNEGEKTEEAEQKEPKTAVVQREESFRRKYNAAVQRSSRLRSSLIFSSLDQQHTSQDTKTAPGQLDEESDKNEAEQAKLPFVSQVLGQRKSTAREPFEWSRYIKSSTFDNSAADSSKPDDGNSKVDGKDSSKDKHSEDLSEKPEVEESLKLPNIEQANSSPSMPPSKPSEAELPKTDPKSLLTSPLYVDMSDPDKRLMFFKELAAKRKAAKAAEAEKSKEKAPVKQPTELTTNATVKKEESVPKETSNAISKDVKNDPSASQSSKDKETRVSTDSEKTAAQAAGDEKSKEKPQTKLKTNTTVKKEESVPKETTDKMSDTSVSDGSAETNATPEDAGISTEALKPLSLSVVPNDTSSKEDSQVKNDPNSSQRSKDEQTIVSIDSENTAAKAAEAEKSKETAPVKPPTELTTNATVKKEECVPKETSDAISKEDSQVKNDPSASQSSKDKETKVSTDSEKTAAKAAEAEKSKETAPVTPQTELKISTTVKKEESVPKETLEKMADTPISEISAETNPTPEDAGVSTEACKPLSPSVVPSDTDPNTSQRSKDEQTRVSTNSENTAAKAAEAEKSKEKALMEPPTEQKTNTTVKKEESVPKETTEKMADTSISESSPEKNATPEDAEKTVSTEACKPLSLSVVPSDKEDIQVKNDPNTSQSSEDKQTGVSTDSEKTELKNSLSAATLSVSAETEAPHSKPPEEPKLSNPAVNESSPSHTPTRINATPANAPSLAQGTDESESPCLDSTSKESSSLAPSSVEVPTSSASISSPSPPSEQNTGSESISSSPSVQSSSSDLILTGSGSQISSQSAAISTTAETMSSNVTPVDSTLTSSISSPNVEESASPSLPSHSVEETSQKSTASSKSQTESESTQAHLDSVSQLTPSGPCSEVDSACVESVISSGTCAAGSEPDISSLQSTTKSEKDIPESDNNSVPKTVGEESEVLGPLNDAKADSTPPNLSLSSSESRLPNVSDLESKSRSDQHETITPTPCSADSEISPAETSCPVHPDIALNASQSETTASPQDEPIQATPPSELNLTGSVTPTPAETVSCSSPLTESVGSVVSPEAEATSASHSPSDSNSLSEHVTTDSNETPMSTETSSPTEPTSKVLTKPDLLRETPESVTSETTPSEPSVPAENSDTNELSKKPDMPDPGEKKIDDSEATHKVNKTTTKESVCSEKTNDQVRQNNCSELPESTPVDVIPPSSQSKQPKSSQSRYQSSTANVLSSSNLRDDTKLLLEQISANSQSRNEATKESPVTDDEKEDEADKNAKRGNERGIGSLSRRQPKSNQEREKLLERIQSMRKERKVYSRFEMAP